MKVEPDPLREFSDFWRQPITLRSTLFEALSVHSVLCGALRSARLQQAGQRKVRECVAAMAKQIGGKLVRCGAVTQAQLEEAQSGIDELTHDDTNKARIKRPHPEI